MRAIEGDPLPVVPTVEVACASIIIGCISLKLEFNININININNYYVMIYYI